MDRLLQDTLRLQLQLENSLFLVNLPTGRLLIEPMQVTSLVDALRYHWPNLTIIQKGDGVIMADARAIESMLTNLVHNAITHGQASEIRITVEPSHKGRMCLRIADNGSGFPGDFKQLGKLFVRHSRGSGSGVGLYISRQLALRMNSTLNFSRGADGGFVAEMGFANSPAPALADQRRQKLA